MSGDSAKARLYEQFARVGKALASARRVELLELLCQGERSVEALARASGLSVTNTSGHLQALRAAALVESRRDGAHVRYRVADDVCLFLAGLRRLAHARLAEIDRLVAAYETAPEELEPLSSLELLERVRAGDVVVLDVRPSEEYAAGHVPGAVSVPLAELAGRLSLLPRDVEIVAYCRGPYCLLAREAVALLRQAGLPARRLEDGLPEWRLAGLPVAVGEERG
jgi:rhodanese-related sulfurtransferase